jgi:hypothetical protein
LHEATTRTQPAGRLAGRSTPGRVCDNKPVRTDYLDNLVWDHITALARRCSEWSLGQTGRGPSGVPSGPPAGDARTPGGSAPCRS